MFLHNEQLREEAHQLALIHDPYLKRASSGRLWKDLQSNMDRLRAFAAELHEHRGTCTQPAEEWLLDNAEFIEGEVLTVKTDLPKETVRTLPHISKTGQLRAFAICDDYLNHTDGQLNEESFTTYIRSYQEVSVLTNAEAWMLPVMLRIAVIRRLSDIMGIVRERRSVCDTVERMLSGIKTSELTPDRLKTVLEEAGQEMPLSGAMIVHLVQHLREHAEDTANIGEWLVCKLENGPESIDSILSFEYQLQAGFQMTTGNLIGSLRMLSRWDWSVMFEGISLVERTLREEQAGDYALMDFASRDMLRHRVAKLALRLKVPEKLIAAQAVHLADRAYAESGVERGGGTPTRKANAAFYLLEPGGLSALRQALKMCGKTGALPEMSLLRRATGTYFQLLGVCFIGALIGFSAWIGWHVGGMMLGGALALLLLAIPASEWAITAAHWFIERVRRPVRLLRYDFSSGIPSEASTMVVMPVIWSSVGEVKALTERLELHYLANRDPNLHFAILSDFMDADSQRLAEDGEIVEAAKAEFKRLNQEYAGSSFHWFHRERRWNPSEGTWMGWERKRGKLVEFAQLLKGKKDTSYNEAEGEPSVLGSLRYIITLDADTQLPLESARRLIGAMHLPYNRPRMNAARTRVVEGYGVLQPRISMSLASVQRSRLAALWSSEPGVDPYAFAISDPYQDALGMGIFTGKGIFDIDVFHEILCDRIPENRVLSHDLLEGGVLRAGLISDIELIDDHPATFRAHQKRQHRWVRGDWQLLLWLLPKARNRKGELLPIDLSLLTRWQMLDNLRRSLLHPALMAILLLAVPLLPGSPIRWFVLVLATFLLPLWRQCLALPAMLRNPRSLFVSLGQAGVALITLPFQSVSMLDAIVTTLYRLLISKRRLLEWTSQAEVERSAGRQGTRGPLGLFGGYALSLVFLGLCLWSGDVAVQGIGVFLAFVWLCAPLAIAWLDQPHYHAAVAFTEEEREELNGLSREIWTFYEDYVTEGDNWLPPDNVQFEPPNGVAHRTSPTNIGLYLSCILAARDFGFIDTGGFLERLERTLDTIERMEKWEGHLYNWYDTETLAPLHPIYVSTVDSGNFAACLIVVKEGLIEWLKAGDSGDERDDLRTDASRRQDQFQVAFAEEITPVNSLSRPGKKSVAGEAARGERLAARMEALIQGTNFRPLYDHKAKLFSLGYKVTQQHRETVLYDLMASEARQASFIAIALGQVSVSHWNALGRTLTKAGKRPVLLSWSGTMFEYLMPWLFMRTYRNTLWDSTYRAVVDRQIEYARQREVPFGISESGFYAFDYRMNYQYRAFGVPGLGFKRGLEEDLVLAPYATIMALPFAKREGLKALSELERLGGRGKYGYYEAMDFTQKRMPEGKRHMVIRSFMAHHQGMSMLTLSNLLLPKTMYGRFHSNKQVRAAELLLQERNPAHPKWIRHPAMHRIHGPDRGKLQDKAEVRHYSNAHSRIPECCVLSNGTFTTVLTNSGSGFTRYEGLSVSRWREDPVRDPWGSYIYVRDLSSERIWSPSYQPCMVEASEQSVQFQLDRAAFTRVDDDIATSMEVCVSPEWNAEVRKISLTNLSTETKVLEVTTFVELALAEPIADDAHTAFSKLFIRTQYDEGSGCLVAGRRPREAKDRMLWAAHSLIAEGHTLGPMEFETDRAAFIGRGHTLAAPQGIRTRLHGKTGSVADPAFVMRRRIRLEPGEQVHLFAITAVSGTREEAVDIVSKFTNGQAVERTFQLSWNRSRIELRNLQLSQREATAFQQFAGQVLYTPPLRKERKQSIGANRKGQSSLWAFGISGDRPIVLVHIDNRSHLPFIVKLLTGHEYLRRLGLSFDLVILNESSGGYHQDLQEALQRAVEHGVDRFGMGSAGIHVIPANQLDEESVTLLTSVARLIMRAGGSSFMAQLRLPRSGEAAALPKALDTSELKEKVSVDYQHSESYDTKDWLFYNGWGGFSPDGREYRIVIKNGCHLPAPWINVLANKRFGSLISELGRGYTWWRNSRECKLTPWSNDPVLDPPTEIGFVRDEESGENWTMTPSSISTSSPYLVTHGWGYSRFDHERSGIKHAMTVFVPLEEPVKVIRVQLKNTTSERRTLSVTYYAEWVIGVQRQANAPYIVTEWDASAKMMTARNQYQETFRDATAFLGIYAQQPNSGHSAETAELSWTSDQEEFIGRNGTAEQPAALGRERLSGRTGESYASCGAVQHKLTLEPGEERILSILLGCEASKNAAASLAQKYSQDTACEQALRDVTDFWEETLSQTTVSTPSREMDVLLNGWLLYQSLACRIWARTAFYQAGGAYGYRDQLQDSLALLHTMPEITRSQILIHASHQYEEGDVQHWWHVETERGIRTLFSDDLLWLPYAVSRYIEQTEDRDILQETAFYITSEPLREGEHERYEETKRSTQSGSVYEHCLRAIDKALSRIGEHGLPLIGVGDWNDGMNLVGHGGRGESVWLGWFICEVLQRFEKICKQRGDNEREAGYRESRERLGLALNEHAWDGQWYRRAFMDDGQWLGSIHNGECRIDAIAQSWSVISGAAPKDRAVQAMQSFDRELVDRELSVVRLLTPPFDLTEPSPGYIQGYPPGIRENGAQYTHGVLWSIMAWSKLGQGDKAFELFHMLNPITHTRTDQEVKRYVGEPYVMAADVYTAEPHRGHAGWTWYTGASGWMYQVGLEWILGIRRHGSRLYIDPRIPSEWPGFKATYRFGKADYAITVTRRAQGEDHPAGRLRLDGNEVEITGDEEPAIPNVELHDDGKKHQVELRI
ncbi:glycosyl transferase family 36 [Paenibacillus alkaliterrae]|uniref:GH36-type glycosyl hydrolase domain-containing protein n=1 Tax=Paenibacillus alkaliterrae TaxID=320909 RepID=UPI001F168E73|nr:glucoamylase family protein [Paenibacillus alkaliterrae]MCF2939364.1 glycosyl transferase family 36 [Paenibacillus alkaliterrae]